MAPMPRDGSLILSDVHGPTLAIVCEECGQRRRYNVERLIAAHRDAKLTDLLTTLADCDKARDRVAEALALLRRWLKEAEANDEGEASE